MIELELHSKPNLNDYYFSNNKKYLFSAWLAPRAVR